MKRTTLILEDSCLEGIRALAHRENRQMSQVVNELIAEGLRQRRERACATLQFPAYDMGVPRVNLADRDALESVMDS